MTTYFFVFQIKNNSNLFKSQFVRSTVYGKLILSSDFVYKRRRHILYLSFNILYIHFGFCCCYLKICYFQLSLVWNLSYYTSPFIITFLYRRGYFVAESITSIAKVSTGIGLLVVISLCMRGFGRAKTANYTKFVKALELAKANKSNQTLKDKLRVFDFEFKDWPVDFDVKSVEG